VFFIVGLKKEPQGEDEICEALWISLLLYDVIAACMAMVYASVSDFPNTGYCVVFVVSGIILFGFVRSYVKKLRGRHSRVIFPWFGIFLKDRIRPMLRFLADSLKDTGED
jgi:hypothetical protein